MVTTRKTHSRVMKNRWTNESRKYKILHYTKWSKGNDIEVKTRLVVIQFTPSNKRDDFAVRWQNYDGATWGGGSFVTYRGAYLAFMRKYREHNDNYRAGNPSHLPGIVK